MMNGLKNDYILVSNENQINDFINLNDNTLTILKAMEPQLIKHFPHSKFSLELCVNLGWTTETKLLLNIHVDEDMFFNGMLDHFNDVYKEIKPIIEDIENNVVLFPKINGRDFDKFCH